MKIVDFLRKLFKLQCRYCRHYYMPSRKECDINIGHWNGDSYCTCYERKIKDDQL